ncbi:MAG TPA: M48 family metallopeptidase, partial [Candidatus Limnocylindrales bacterium]|nr:M48 family metallopeptidase [Candidatus Limnocylindrales bacterium]
MQMRSTFHEQQAANRRNSIVLIVLVTLLLAALGFAIGYGTTGYVEGAFGVTTGAIVLAMLLSVGSYFAGDKLVLATSGAKEVTQEAAPQLMNVVQEMAISAGVPMPKVYIIDDTAPNAFATGRDPKHASVAITTGLLQKLDREELQGVMGHELSHVRNFDIRFSLLVAVLVGSIALLADFFLRFTFWGGGRGGRGGDRDRGGGGLVAIMFILAIVLAVLAPIIGRLVQLAVSRQREYLADASSVELTRNPVGLERALAKIASDREVLEVANRATQHLYFTNPIKKFEERSSSLFSTHPAVLDRINRLRQLT